MPPTPTLDRMQAPHRAGWTPREGDVCRLVDHSQLIGDFLDWLDSQGVRLAHWGHETYLDPIRRRDLDDEARGDKPDGVSRFEWLGEVVDWEEREGTEDRLIPDGRSIQKLLAEYFGIDEDAVEREKRALLDWQRARYAEASS